MKGDGEMKTGHVKMLSLPFTRRLRQFRGCGVAVGDTRVPVDPDELRSVGADYLASLISLQIST